MSHNIPDYVPTEDWADDTKWTNAIMQAFSDALTTYLNDSLVANLPTGSMNIGALAATTTTTSDSLKITGPTGVALSTTGFDIELPSDTTQGRFEQFTLSSDITLKISGAHWGMGTKGNVTGAILRWGFVNDGGATPALAIMYLGGREVVASTSTSTTQTSITAPEQVLVSRTLAVGTWPIVEFGYCYADFNDTGDIWAIQSGIGKVLTGVLADGIWQPWAITEGTSGWSAFPTVSVARWMSIKKTIYYTFYLTNGTGTSDATTANLAGPAKCAITGNAGSLFFVEDGGVEGSGGYIISIAGETTLELIEATSTNSSATWTNSGNKTANGYGCYEAYYG